MSDAAPLRPIEKRSAWGRLTGSWSIALRMAKRDVRRHKGRSALIVAMVSVPTMLLVLAFTLVATGQVTGTEQIPGRMGNGVAALDWPASQVVNQSFDGSNFGGDLRATAIPGFDDDGSSFDNTDAIARLTGSTAIPFSSEGVSVRLGERRVSATSLALDPRSGLEDRVEVTSGRLPERAGEALVTDMGKSQGMPTSGTLTINANGHESSVTIVGTAFVPSGGTFEPEPGLVVPEPFLEGEAGGGWILTGSDPVTWDETKQLNTHGLVVYSAELLTNPPSTSELSPDVQELVAANTNQLRTLVAIGAALLLVITTLLVGPAFAVSASRQRRTLALAASNGATTGQLRHTVLAQALVLGVLSAVVGAALGVGAAALLSRTPVLPFIAGGRGPFEVPLVPIALITVTAALSAVIAALIPARRLGRLDIIGVMKGQSVSPPPSRIVFVIGAILAAGGGFGVVTIAAGQATRQYDGGGELMIVLATIALVVGAVMLAPTILVLIARFSARLPFALRMATRDAGRQRTRSVPSIAAVMAGVAALTMVLISSGSDDEQSRREYTPQNVNGDALVSLSGASIGEWIDPGPTTAAFDAVRSGLTISRVSGIATGDPHEKYVGDSGPTEPYELALVNVVPPGCTPERAVDDQAAISQGQGLEGRPTGERMVQPPCQRIGTQAAGNIVSIGVTTTDEIVRRLDHLGRSADAAVIRDGGVVVARPPDTSSIVKDGTVTIMSATQSVDPASDAGTPPLENLRTITVPAVEVELTKDTTGALLHRAMLAPEELATKAGWPTRAEQLTIHDPNGPISQDLAEQLAGATPDDVWVVTEEGFQSPIQTVVAVLVGILTLLLLVITLTSTALSLAEQENDQATLAALGSGRGTRRVMAAAQAFSLCAIGAVLGVIVGLVPGIALTYPLTARNWDPITGMEESSDPIILIPWLILLGFAIAVPAVAAALAAAGIRKAPDATHRTA